MKSGQENFGDKMVSWFYSCSVVFPTIQCRGLKKVNYENPRLFKVSDHRWLHFHSSQWLPQYKKLSLRAKKPSSSCPTTYVGALKRSLLPPFRSTHHHTLMWNQFRWNRKDLRHQAPDAAPRIFSILVTKCFPELGKGRKIKRVLRGEERGWGGQRA